MKIIIIITFNATLIRQTWTTTTTTSSNNNNKTEWNSQMWECKNLNRKPKRHKHFRLERSWCIVESFHWESVLYGCVDYYFIVFIILREKCSYSEFFWSIFYRIRTEYGEILRISPYSVRMLENTDQKNYEHGHFLRSVLVSLSCRNKTFAMELI